MSLDISEIRPDDRPMVDELLGTDKQRDETTVDPTHRVTEGCRSVLSLVARDDGNIIGAILCYYDDQQGHFYQITVSNQSQYPDLDKALVDKALLKLNAQGARSCRIRLSEESQHQPFWDAVKWGERPELTDKPISSSAVLDRLANQETTSLRAANDHAVAPEQISETSATSESNQD